MRFDKFTVKAQEAVVRAQELAQRRDHSEILPLHLLDALLGEEEGVVMPLLQKLGGNVAKIAADVGIALDALPRATGTQIGIARATNDVFQTAQKEADRLRKVLLELEGYEHDILYPLASRQLSIDLDDGVKTNYPKFGAALRKITGLEVNL